MRRKTNLARNFVIGLLALCFALGCLWRLTSLHERFGLETLIHWGHTIQGHPWTPVAVVAIYILGGLLVFMHAVLLWATALTFEPWQAFVYCQLGSLASAMVVYSLGRVLRRDVVAKMAGSYVEGVSRALAHKGILSLFLLHVFPICPFSVLNLLAGATHIRMKDFIPGTILGMTPGIVLVCFFGNRLIHIVMHPHWTNIASFVAFVGIGVWAFRRLRKRLVPNMIGSK